MPGAPMHICQALRGIVLASGLIARDLKPIHMFSIHAIAIFVIRLGDFNLSVLITRHVTSGI